MNAIPLRTKDGSVRARAFVDPDDYHQLKVHRWRLNIHGYAMRGKEMTILMHREVMGLAIGDPRCLDHINRNRLDNRKENLRIATRQEQMQNRSSDKNSTSRFRGVSWEKSRQRWLAKAMIDGVLRFQRRYRSEVEAAQAVNAWRLENMPYAQPDPELKKIEEQRYQ